MVQYSKFSEYLNHEAVQREHLILSLFEEKALFFPIEQNVNITLSLLYTLLYYDILCRNVKYRETWVAETILLTMEWDRKFWGCLMIVGLSMLCHKPVF